jgi:asparagine N-glycosylation enzyme membrane subunit Stt3
MTLDKAGIISFVPLGAMLGAVLCKPHGIIAVLAGLGVGMVAGRYVGWLYGIVIILLMAAVTIPWNLIRKFSDPKAMADGEQESLVQISSWAMIPAAITSGIIGFSAGWLCGIIAALVLAFLIALISVIWTQRRLGNI